MDAPKGTTTSAEYSDLELRLAARNHGMPLEVLQHDVTPIGMHYLLIHYDIPYVDESEWTLTVDGAVGRRLTLTLDDLRARPAVTQRVTMECAGNGRTLMRPRAISQPWIYEAVGTAEWTGTPLAPLIAEAGLDDDAVEVVFTGLDTGVESGKRQSYARSLTRDEVARDDVIVAYEINGQPLPPQHGYPARLIVPGWYGMASVKWLTSITAVTTPFEGHQQARAYRLRQAREEPGTPLTRIAVRCLMVPPGVPEFPTRHRFVPRAGWSLTGRAWSGAAPVVRVEVTDAGGATWQEARVDDPPAPHAWQRWSCDWRPRGAGEVELWCRATDADGNTQPLEPAWNLGGYAGNAVQRVPVTVED
ncbi:MAG TPA: sulfite oxidase [Egibacteraceae bacterium]|nr:sulfite oxidase [Egibacteraceae bacterium]